MMQEQLNVGMPVEPLLATGEQLCCRMNEAEELVERIHDHLFGGGFERPIEKSVPESGLRGQLRAAHTTLTSIMDQLHAIANQLNG